MADAKMYAWAPIKAGKGEKVERIPAGAEVSAASLGLDKEAFQKLVDSGSVRAVKYPDMPEGYQDSPVNFLRQQAIAAAGEDEALTVMANAQLEPGAPQASPARKVLGEGESV